MNRDVKVSIIVPVYNTSKYLRKCLDSLLGQTCKEIEIIVINDGSKDESLSIIEEYQRSNPQRIVLISRENRGIGYTRNEGIGIAKGEYITFIDSDDCVHHTFCEHMYKCAKEKDLDMVVCDYEEVDEAGKKIKDVIIDDFKVSNIRKSPNLIFDINSSPWNKLYRTKVIKDNDITFPEKLKYEDMVFAAEMISAVKRIGKLNEKLVYYLIRSQGETKIVDERVFDIFDVFNHIERKMRDYHVMDDASEYYEWLVINRMMVYNIQQRYQVNKKVSQHFIDRSYNFLDRKFPQWRKNKQYIQNNSKLKRCLKSNKWIMKMYVGIMKG